jgi:hypothetical protein
MNMGGCNETSIIPENEMSLLQLEGLFKQRGFVASIHEDGYVNLAYPDGLSEIVWLDDSAKLVRMRVVLLGKEKIRLIPIAKLHDLAAEMNGSFHIGTTITDNPLGLLLDYSVIYRHGILEHTLLESVELLRRAAMGAAESYLSDRRLARLSTQGTSKA